MGKEFKKKYMHPTRRKLVDMVETGEYAKNTTVGYTKKEDTHKVGDVWEDEHKRYEKKEGYTLKTGKNSEALQEIRKYLEEKSKCNNAECKTIKKTANDLKFIQNGGFCLNCTSERETELRETGLFQEYQDYKVWTKMIVYGKTKLEELRQSLSEVKAEYEYVNEDGSTEIWKLPKSVDEVKAEIQEMIDIGEGEIKQLETNRETAFDKLKENNYEHYI
jgi:hypothetical protein|tara:strand:+ start:1472 stop:2128 length:657 start_codon:yes stop_codon:yes gene_type:complete